MSKETIERVDDLLLQADTHLEEGEFLRARDVADELYEMGFRGYANDIYCDVELAELEAKADDEGNWAFDNARDNALVM